jgi:membrane-bound lytic murein transglycosylase B
MKTNNSPLLRSIRLSLVCTAAAATVLSLASCRVKQTQEAKAPEVEVKEGQMPKYDVDAAKVTVQPQQKEITVPKVTTEQRTITVPDVDVTMPDDQAASPTPEATP